MRIEIIVGNEEPKIFNINKTKSYLGSHESCDIILSADGVSRKHIEIINENENIFVIDQGSTNGSFMNEERLIPGRKTEFTSFFPLRLGDNVLVTLLSYEEANHLVFNEESQSQNLDSHFYSSSNQDATRAISLKDLQMAKTKNLVKRRQETVNIKRAKVLSPPRSKINDKTRMRLVKIITVCIIAIAVYYNFFNKDSNVSDVVETVKTPEINSSLTKIRPIVEIPLVDQADFATKEKLEEIRKGIGCVSENEKYFCKQTSDNSVSAIQIGTMIHIFVDGKDYYQKAKSIIPVYRPELGEILDPKLELEYLNDLKFTAVLFFLFNEVPKDLNYELLKDVKLTFVISFLVNEGIRENVAVVIVPEALQKITQNLKPQHFDMAARYGVNSFYLLKGHFIIY